MSRLFALVILFASSVSFAHVKAGVYNGKDQTGKPCSFEVGEQYFENNMPHPLNERVPVSNVKFADTIVSVEKWNVGHPPVVDLEKGLVRFNHDYFQGIAATKTGGAMLVLLKDEEESADGHSPLGITYIDDNYRSRQDSKKLTCTL